MEWLGFPLAIIGVAFIIHGFPSFITINKNYYKNEEKK
jgi:hypothetical protein